MATFDGLIIQWLLAPERVPSAQLIAGTLKRTATLSPRSTPSQSTATGGRHRGVTEEAGSDSARGVEIQAREPAVALPCYVVAADADLPSLS